MKLSDVKKNVEIGTDGNIIVPIDGEKISPEEQNAQFEKDFGDNVDELLDDSIIQDGYDDNAHPIVQQKDEDGNEVVVTPNGQVIGDLPDDVDDDPTITKTTTQKKPVEKKSEINLDNYVAKESYDKLQKDYNLLQGEFNKLKETANEGILNLSDNDLSIIRRIKYDYENTPLGLITEKYYNGELDVDSIVPVTKPPQDFMPEGESFDPTEAYTPGTFSFQARERFEQNKEQVRGQFRKAAEYINSVKSSQKNTEDAKKEAEEMDKQLMSDLKKKVPQAEKYEDTFKKWLSKQNNFYMLAWVAFSQAFNNAVSKTKNIRNKPKVNVSSAVASDTPFVIEDDVDQELFDEFGND